MRIWNLHEFKRLAQIEVLPTNFFIVFSQETFLFLCFPLVEMTVGVCNRYCSSIFIDQVALASNTVKGLYYL